jgi:hypothetical protein
MLVLNWIMPMSDSRRHRQQEMTDGDNMVLLEEELESVEDDLDSDELDEEEPTLCCSGSAVGR